MKPSVPSFRASVFLGTLSLLVACVDPNTLVDPADGNPAAPVLAKAPPSTLNGSVTVTDAGMDYTSDGRGSYTNGICGVSVSGPTSGGVSLTLNAGTPSTPCADYPRRAWMSWALQHVSDNPHIDQPGTGSDNMRFNMTFGSGGIVSAAVFNGGTRCYYRSRNGTLRGVGLRFDPANYPKSSALVYQQLTANTWRVQSQPYPNNLAYCEGDGGISYWHVNLDVMTWAQ